MSDRLEELLEQKRLIESHLRWLESEIQAEHTRQSTRPDEESAREAPQTAPPAASPVPETIAPGAEHPVPAVSEPSAHETRVSASPVSREDFEVDHVALKSEVRRGCLIYLGIFGGIALVAGVFLYLLYR